MSDQTLLVPAGPVDLDDWDTRATPGVDSDEMDKSDGKEALADLGEELADLQERLFAEGRSGSARRALLILQGMDTAGKGGVVRHTIGLVDPQGVRITSFGSPTPEELDHDFLWRIRKALPEAGYIGVFDRSHYEDVLIARVRRLAEADEIERRYEAINDFEAELAASGTVIIKVMLHVGAQEQRERLRARLDDPAKHWKFNPGDIDDRSRWPQFQRAYELAVERTNTEHAPWHIVPADRKWYRNLAVGRLLLDHLRALGPQWPPADFDVAEQIRRLRDEDPLP